MLWYVVHKYILYIKMHFSFIMLLKEDLCWEISLCKCANFYIVIWENSWLALMKNSFNIANNVNLIVYTIDGFF